MLEAVGDELRDDKTAGDGPVDIEWHGGEVRNDPDRPGDAVQPAELRREPLKVVGQIDPREVPAPVDGLVKLGLLVGIEDDLSRRAQRVPPHEFGVGHVFQEP